MNHAGVAWWRARARPSGLAFFVLLLAACGGDDESTAVPPPKDTGNPGDADGAVVCGALETTAEGGGCAAVGVTACGTGFEPDGTAGCRAILPVAACPMGQMALPGETACREVMPCGDGAWGDIPTEATTEFVDSAYPGTDSDGSEAKPWTTIQEGIDAAVQGAVVAVAQGIYDENISFYGKKARLWGKCPSLVEIRGKSSGIGAVDMGYAGDGSEVHGLAITGPLRGLVVSGALGIVAENVWIHDTGLYGVGVLSELGETEFTIRGALVEATPMAGILAQGVAVTVEDTLVRGTTVGGDAWRAIEIDNTPNGPSATGAIRRTVAEGSPDIGIYVSGSTVSIEDTLVRDGNGPGIETYDDPVTKLRADLTVRSSIVERCREAGIYNVGSIVTVEACTVKQTEPKLGTDTLGRGIYFQRNPDSGERATGSVRGSLIEGSRDIGLCISSSETTVEALLIRDTKPTSPKQFGDGITIVDGDAFVSVAASRIEGSARAGLAAFGANATLARTTFECNMVDLDAEQYLKSGPSATLEDQGGNVCGCGGATIPCEVKSIALEPPAPPE